MGAQFNVYVGVYAVVPEVEQKVKEQKYGCSNTECKNHSKMNRSDKFCSACGSPGMDYEVEKEIKSAVDWYSFAEKNGLDPELFYSPGQMNYLVANKASYGECFTEYEEPCTFEFDADYMQKTIDKFKKDNSLELAAFKHQYGVELKIVFGSFSYFS